jgi:hypothetical protein
VVRIEDLLKRFYMMHVRCEVRAHGTNYGQLYHELVGIATFIAKTVTSD